jgi:hypothetical protein
MADDLSKEDVIGLVRGFEEVAANGIRRKLILAGKLPKFSDLGQGAIGKAIEAAGTGQFGRPHKVP